MADREAFAIQRDYYARTAAHYDRAHVFNLDEHRPAMALLTGAISVYGLTSVLDVGAGTGRVHAELHRTNPDVTVLGIEPVAELRAIGHGKGIPHDALVDGVATKLEFVDASFDLVCCFALLHHVPGPELVIDEMLRVARHAIFISDANNFAQGSFMVRLAKQSLNAVGLWPLANWLKTAGRGYSISEGDGLAYSFSLFNHLPAIRRRCSSTHLMNTGRGGTNVYRTSPHCAVLAFK